MAKFKVGDKVTVGGQKGEITELGQHDEHWLASHPQLYGVRFEAWEPVTEQVFGTDHKFHDVTRFKNPVTGELRDHAADTVTVTEDQIEGEAHAAVPARGPGEGHERKGPRGGHGHRH